MKPEVFSTISGYSFCFADEKIEAKINRIRVTSDGLKGEIKLILGSSQKEEPAFIFNFTSDIRRKSTIKSLSEKYPEWKPEIWLEVIDELCRQIDNLSRGGEDWSIIQPTISEVKHPGYYIEPVIMKGMPNIIFGDPEVAKTTIALTMLGLIANGIDDSETGLIATTSAKVALLDWENDKNTTDFTLSRLVNGMTLPYFEPLYQRCTHPFADEIERIGNFVDATKPKVIAIDSLGMAAGSLRFDSSGKEAALRMFEALRQFPGITWLIIAQNAKSEEGKKTIFGSIFYHYGARNVFQLKRSKDQFNKDELIVALLHEKSNFSGHYPPIGLRLTYTDSTIGIEHTEANMSQFMDRVSLTKDLLDFLKTGARPVKAIADELGMTDNRVRVMLSQLKKRKLVINLGSGLWGATIERQDEL